MEAHVQLWSGFHTDNGNFPLPIYAQLSPSWMMDSTILLSNIILVLASLPQNSVLPCLQPLWSWLRSCMKHWWLYTYYGGRVLPSLEWIINCMLLFLHVACGVAHQALEGIEPKGQDILVQGTTVWEVYELCDLAFKCEKGKSARKL